MRFLQICCVTMMLAALPLFSGCDKPNTAQSSETDGYPGAFPPTLTDMEYHTNAWTRSDCMVCHEEGVQEAPIVKHKSVPKVALDAKCRTCHVQVAGSKPAK